MSGIPWVKIKSSSVLSYDGFRFFLAGNKMDRWLEANEQVKLTVSKKKKNGEFIEYCHSYFFISLYRPKSTILFHFTIQYAVRSDYCDYCVSLVIRWSFFPFQNNPQNLGLSYKMDLDFWDCFGRIKHIAKFCKPDLVFCSHSREENLVLLPNKYSRMQCHNV